MSEITSQFVNKLIYRKATYEDRDILFAWVNDPVSLKNSNKKDPVKYDSHLQWLQNKLDSSESWIFLITEKASSVALLRLDRIGNNLIISYSVAPEHRKKGIGGKLIAMLPDIVKAEKIQFKKIIAKVYKSNIASIKIFEKEGYKKYENDGYYIFIK